MPRKRAAPGAQEEGVRIALELIEKIRGKQGIHGLHIMPVGWEDVVPRIVTEAEFLQRDLLTETEKVPVYE